MASRGKKFEDTFKRDGEESVPNSLCYRLYDVTMGYKAIANAGDFICYSYPCCYIIDCKSKEGNTLPFSDLRQYDLMLKYKGIKGLLIGFMVGFVDHDRVLGIPIETMEKIKNEGLKSFNINKMSVWDYFYLEIPSNKLRVFMKSDYSALVNYSGLHYQEELENGIK